jgi:hypothetical protein
VKALVIRWRGNPQLDFICVTNDDVAELRRVELEEALDEQDDEYTVTAVPVWSFDEAVEDISTWNEGH